MKLVTKLCIGSAITIGSIGVIVGITAPLISKNNSNDTNYKISKQEFNVLSSTSLSNVNYYNSSTYPLEANIYDAKYNNSAKNLFNNVKQQVNNSQLEKEFESNIKSFLNAYVHSIDEHQLYIKDVEVNNKLENGNYPLEVNYIDENQQESSRTIEWHPDLSLINNYEINTIKEAIINVSINNDQKYVKELKKKYLGNNENNQSNDNGVFDRVSKISNQYNGFNRIVAYKLRLSDFFQPLTPRENNGCIDIKNSNMYTNYNSEFYVPALCLGGGIKSFVPSTRSRLELEQNFGVDKNNIDLMFANNVEITNNKQIEQILRILFSANNNQSIGSKIRKIKKLWISTENVNNQITKKLLVEFKSNTTPELYVW